MNTPCTHAHTPATSAQDGLFVLLNAFMESEADS